MFLSRGRLQLFKTAEEIPELAQDRLLELVEGCAELCIPRIHGGADYHPISLQSIFSADRGLGRSDAHGSACARETLHGRRWLRKDKDLRLEEQKMQRSGKDAKNKTPSMATWSNGWTAGRMTASMKDSSNAVMRM